ncbi:MAG TPA: hypothetical protein VHG91_21510 [Longimicrobium sp.]|nr:hypothetical protein [Longimicrobium sp.]
MSIRRETEEMIQRRIADDERAARTDTCAAVIAFLVCIAWCVLGGALVVAGFAVVGVELGEALLFAGSGVSIAGPVLTVVYWQVWKRKNGLE